jgi:SAM-dependent methyltransferase
MLWRFPTYGLAAGVVVVLLVGTLVWRFSFFYAPFAWTGEPARLARVLGLEPGMDIADVGAGSGALAMAMAELVGNGGQVFATELDPERRADIERRVTRASVRNVHAVTAAESETRLPGSCCDAVYLRAVFHHIASRSQFAGDVARALRPGGRVAVIDFPPGTLWFHGADHGVEPDSVLRAFEAAGYRLRERVDDWGGGMFLIVFERDAETDR